MSSRDDSRRRRVTYQQLESLWEFLNCHNNLAVGYNKSAQAREYSRRMWMTVAESLNSQGEGATKDWKGWSNYWVDYKAKLKRRVAVLHTSQTRTGGGPSDAIPLNDLEQKFLSLLGEGFGMGLPNTQVDPFPNLATVNNEQQLDPVAGPSHVELEFIEDILSNEEMVQPQEETAVQIEVTEEVPRQRDCVRRRRRSNRQPPLTQEAARRILVEVAKENLELHKQELELRKKEAELHKQELELHKQDSKVWQDMMIAQQSIATVLRDQIRAMRLLLTAKPSVNSLLLVVDNEGSA